MRNGGQLSLGTVLYDFGGKDIRSNRSHKSHRPITVLSFRIDAYWGSGDLLAVFHFHNIVLYILVCILYRYTIERLVISYLGLARTNFLTEFVNLYVQYSGGSKGGPGGARAPPQI